VFEESDAHTVATKKGNGIKNFMNFGKDLPFIGA
jgi:hypothetical protein